MAPEFEQNSANHALRSLALGVGIKFIETRQLLVQGLVDNGITVATSCESGLCGTCRTGYLQGQPDHRDYILSDEEKERDFLICCAHSLTPMRILDL